MEREELERAVDALFALCRAGDDDRSVALELLRERLAGVSPDRDRALAGHLVVRFGQRVTGVGAEARYVAAVALRAAARAAGRPAQWSYAKLGELWGVDRNSAQTVLRRPRGGPEV